MMSVSSLPHLDASKPSLDMAQGYNDRVQYCLSDLPHLFVSDFGLDGVQVHDERVEPQRVRHALDAQRHVHHGAPRPAHAYTMEMHALASHVLVNLHPAHSLYLIYFIIIVVIV